MGLINMYCSVGEWPVNGLTHMPDVLPPVHSSEDWQAAFGFPPGQDDHSDLVCVEQKQVSIIRSILLYKMLSDFIKDGHPNWADY